MIKNIYFTYCLIPIIIAKNEIVQHEVYIVANIVPDVRPGCLYRSAKAATIGSSLTQGFAVLRAAFYHWQQVLSPLSIFIMFLEEAMQELKDRIVKEGKILPGSQKLPCNFGPCQSWWGIRSPRPRNRAYGACRFAALTAWLRHESKRKKENR